MADTKAIDGETQPALAAQAGSFEQGVSLLQAFERFLSQVQASRTRASTDDPGSQMLLTTTNRDILAPQPEAEGFAAHAANEIQQIIDRLDTGIVQERTAINALLSRLRSTRISA